MYPVNEIFQTIQGEGWHTGVPAIFIRLQGCDVGCAWCDTRHTWDVNPDQRIEITDLLQSAPATAWASMSPTQIVAVVSQPKWTAKWIVITGGEPAMHDLRPLCEALEQAGYQIQLETSGTYPVQVSASTWVTVSPKIGMRGGHTIQNSALARADEIKHPVAREEHIAALEVLLKQVSSKPRICLQPISQKPAATALAMQVCIEKNWRFSAQMHKYLEIE
jgi:7-carboxy-7-deazaguanine synthase